MNPAAAPQVGLEKPTRVRYGVLGFACALSMITYLDRVCFGSVVGHIVSEFSLDEVQRGWIFFAFGFAYAAFEIPSGWLGDRFGARKTLIRIVLWWSIFTALTGAIYPTAGWPFLAFGLMFLVRFLFGMGEAGAYPNIARAFHSWFPFEERGAIKGAVWMAGRLAGGVTPLIVFALLQETTVERSFTAVSETVYAGADGQPIRAGLRDPRFQPGTKVIFKAVNKDGEHQLVQVHILDKDAARKDKVPSGLKPGTIQHVDVGGGMLTMEVPATLWRHTFWIFGSIGLVWCVLFAWWYRDHPEENAGVNQAEITLIKGGTHHAAGPLRVPWLRLLTNRNLWTLCIIYFMGAYGWYFNITYLPDYLKVYHNVTYEKKWTKEFWEASLMTGMPLLLGSVACLVGGVLSDMFIRTTGNRKWGRRLFGVVGKGLCALCFFCCILVDSAWGIVLAVSFAAFFNDLTMGAAWASCLDIGGKYSGIVAGCMNSIGNLGGALAGILTGVIVSKVTSWSSGLEMGDPGYLAATHLGWTCNFIIFGGVYVIAMVLWFLFDSTKPVAEE